jgi:hypothetical protein
VKEKKKKKKKRERQSGKETRRVGSLSQTRAHNFSAPL